MSKQGLVHVLLGIVVIVAIAMPTGCSKEKASEKMTEKMIEKATGEKTDVDLDGGDVRVKTGETDVHMTKTDEWPSDMFESVPRFTYGKVERVTSATEGGMKKFNVYLREVPDDASDRYAAELKQAGWDVQVMAMGPKGGMMSAQKGQIGVQFAHNKGEKTGVFIAFQVEE